MAWLGGLPPTTDHQKTQFLMIERKGVLIVP
jgi:hypothetical protein